jgi:hypothetical protein
VTGRTHSYALLNEIVLVTLQLVLQATGFKPVLLVFLFYPGRVLLNFHLRALRRASEELDGFFIALQVASPPCLCYSSFQGFSTKDW